MVKFLVCSYPESPRITLSSSPMRYGGRLDVAQGLDCTERSPQPQFSLPEFSCINGELSINAVSRNEHPHAELATQLMHDSLPLLDGPFSNILNKQAISETIAPLTCGGMVPDDSPSLLQYRTNDVWMPESLGSALSLANSAIFDDPNYQTQDNISHLLEPIFQTGDFPRALNHLSLPDSEPVVGILESETPIASFTQTRTDRSSTRSIKLSQSLDTQSSLLGQDSESWKAEDYGHVPPLTSETYFAIEKNFSLLNSTHGCFVPFTGHALPSLDKMNVLVQVYMEEFHPVFPILHRPTFNGGKDHWMLVLAVAAIGSNFSKTLRSLDTFFMLQEFLRRAIHIQVGALSTQGKEKRVHLTFAATFLGRTKLQFFRRLHCPSLDPQPNWNDVQR